MVNTDRNVNTVNYSTKTLDRNIYRPLDGFRRSLQIPVDATPCEKYGDTNRERRLPPYS